MAQLFVQNGQSVFDVALACYGEPNAIYDLATENPTLNIGATTDLGGQTITYTPRVKSSNNKEAVKKADPPNKVVTIRDDQNVFDLALQYYGKPELVYRMLAENPDIDSILTDYLAGKKLGYTESIEFVPNYYRTNKLTVATRYPTKFVGRITEESEGRITEDSNKRILENG